MRLKRHTLEAGLGLTAFDALTRLRVYPRGVRLDARTRAAVAYNPAIIRSLEDGHLVVAKSAGRNSM